MLQERKEESNEFLEDLRESNDLLNEQISFDNKMRKVILEAADDKHIDLRGATVYRNKKTGKSYIYSDGKFLPVSVKHVKKDAETLISRNYRDSGYLVKKEPKNAELKSGYDSLTADQLDALEKGAFKDFLEKRRNQEKMRVENLRLMNRKKFAFRRLMT